METTILLSFILLFSFLAIKNFNLALAFSVFALPAYLIDLDFGSISYTMLEVMIWVLFVIHLNHLWKQYRWKGLKEILSHPDKKFLSLRLAIGLFFFAATTALFVSPVPRSAFEIWKTYFLQPLLFFIILVQSVRTKKELKSIFHALGLSVLTVAVFGIFQKFTGWKMNPIYLASDGSVDRVTSVFGFPNAIGLYVGPIIVLFTGLLAETHGLLKKGIEKAKNAFLFWFQFLVVGFGITLLLLAKSEGAIAGVAVALLFLAFSIKSYRLSTLIVTILLTGILVVFPSQREYLMDKIFFQGWSEQVRISMWRETIELIKDHPFLGAGLSGYPIEFVKYHRAWYIEIFRYPHNVLLNFWVEIGLLGVLAFICILFEYLRLCLRLIQEKYLMGFTLLAVMIEILIHGLVDVPYFKNDLSVLFWIFIATAVILNPGALTGKAKGVG
jgi:putative inorganic carbon (HCO3(-)) transporter